MAKRARKSKSEILKQALETAVSPSDIKDVLQAMVTAAKAGDCEAAKLVMDRVLGKPSVAQKPTGSPMVQVNVGDNRQREVIRLIQRLKNPGKAQQAIDDLRSHHQAISERQAELLMDEDEDNSQE